MERGRSPDVDERSRQSGTTLVTGASGGIGRAIVEALTARGDTVAFTWHSNEAAAREVEAATGSAAFRFDLADRKAPDQLVRDVEAELGPLVGLVNNAGVRHEGLLALTSDSAWDQVIDLNLGGAFRCCRAVLRGMVHRRQGSIVNIASLAAERGVAGLAGYAASKAGLLALTRCLAREVGKRGVRVNAVVPGFVPTRMTEGLPERAVTALRSAECLPGGSSPEDVGEAVAFLLSDKAATITGQAFHVDAGASA